MQSPVSGNHEPETDVSFLSLQFVLESHGWAIPRTCHIRSFALVLVILASNSGTLMQLLGDSRIIGSTS